MVDLESVVPNVQLIEYSCKTSKVGNSYLVLKFKSKTGKVSSLCDRNLAHNSELHIQGMYNVLLKLRSEGKYLNAEIEQLQFIPPSTVSDLTTC